MADSALTPQASTGSDAGGLLHATVANVHHYTSRLFKFRVTRPPSLRFRSGEFIMVGLQDDDGSRILRAYSIASPEWDDELEFYSIKVSDGKLTSRLQFIQPGDTILLSRKATGTLVLDALKPGRRLFLFSTGTGFAPFASILREPDTYKQFDQVIATHTCREAAELEYSKDVIENLTLDPLVGSEAEGRVTRYATCTRENYNRMGRITSCFSSGRLFDDLSIPPFDPATDRAMICGSLAMTHDMRALLLDKGLREGSRSSPEDFVIERAFVD